MPQNFKYSFKTSDHSELSLVVYNIGFQKCPPGYGWGPGVRDHFLLHYIVSGSGIYQTGGRTYSLSAGEAFLAYPDTEIYYCADKTDPWEYYWVGFSGVAAPLLMAQTPFSRSNPAVKLSNGEILRRGLLDIYKARGSDYPDAVRMAGYLQAALAVTMKGSTENSEQNVADYAGRGAAFLQQNYSASIGVEDAANHVGVSRSHLYRAFQNEFGCSPSEYLTQYRMQRAIQLLCHSDLSINAVAASVGYEDPLYFSRAFKRETGSSPTQYRLKKKE